MPDRTGQKLGNYQVVRALGHGGFGDVFLGQHLYLQTYAAIKVLQARLAQNDLEVFLQEARTVANLTHPHIVRVLEFGEEGYTPYLIMDYCPGGTLRQRHPRGTRISLATCVPYIKQIAGALHYAHDRKVIHRDVKPENMLIGPDNTLLLSDFGIATISQSSRYQQQDIVGTVAYSAPEQLQGKARAASDQYSLGIVLYEWLTGELPYRGSFVEIVSQHVIAPLPTVCDKVPSLPPTVEQVLQKALAKDPHQRFPSIAVFAEALEQAVQGTLNLAVLRTNSPDSQANIPTVVKPPLVTPGIPANAQTFYPTTTRPDFSQPGANSIPPTVSAASSAYTPPPTTSLGVSSILPTVSASGGMRTPSPVALPAYPQPVHSPQRQGKTGLYIAIIVLLLLALGGVSARLLLATLPSGSPHGQAPGQTPIGGQPPATSTANTQQPTTTPVSSVRTIPQNTEVPCVSTEVQRLTCNDVGFTLELTNIVIDPAGITTYNFIVTNKIADTIEMSGSFANGMPNTDIYLEDALGKSTYPVSGTFLDKNTLAGGQKLPLTVLFQLYPQSGTSYTLHMIIYDNHVTSDVHDDITYKTSIFTF